MKRRYKLLLIILIGGILTFIINSTVVRKKVSLVSLGDGLSLGMTPYKIAGTSFNDYLREYFEKKGNLENYNNEFSIVHLSIHELNEYLEENYLGSFTRIPIKQTLAKAEVITIAIGIDEFADDSLMENISERHIDSFLNEYEKLLKGIREFYEKSIVVVGLYPAYDFSQKDAIEVNSKLRLLCGKYNANFIDILAISLNNDYYLEKNSYYMNYKAHQEIANIISNMYK